MKYLLALLISFNAYADTFVDTTKNVIPAIGYDTLRVQPTTEIAPASDIGAFRIVCDVSHMSNNDPIVYPSIENGAHHHTFFGNTSTSFDSNIIGIASTGTGTCIGGIANRSAYWVPSMIDTATHAPIAPYFAIFYYKSGYIVPSQYITTPPAGLRMIAGNGKAITAETSSASFSCLTGTYIPPTKTIPICNIGEDMQASVSFPQCWDGVHLDSPNHKAHMAYSSNDYQSFNKCPTTHPVAIPEIVINYRFKTTVENQTATWRLSSDSYDTTIAGGYSLHADWINGWDRGILKTFVQYCLNGKKDGHAHLLCDGRAIY